jgi:Ca-activated chloride channel family protein
VAPELLPHLISGDSVARSRSGIPALIAAWCLASFAAAGPSWQQLPQPVLQKQDALVLIMDLSYSMLATDLQPSRQDRVRRKLLDLLRERREGLTALIAYAGDAHIVAPLTDDNPTIANLLPALTPDMMPLPGSNPVDAVERATGAAGLRRGAPRPSAAGHGRHKRSDDATGSLELLSRENRQLAVLGVGTEVGAPIALPGGGFLKDDNGEIVVPALDETPLRSLAAKAPAARYRRMSVDDSDLAALLRPQYPARTTRSLDRQADRWQDMAHWFVLPLLLFALASFRRG